MKTFKKKKKKKLGSEEIEIRSAKGLHGICVRAAYLCVHWFPHGEAHCCGIILGVLESSTPGRRERERERKGMINGVW